jgi:predicted lipid-binding transport protein (Tim44 family)
MMFKKVWITAAAALAIGLSGMATEVDAKRLGGGRSVGQQSGMAQRTPAQQPPQQMNQAGQPQSAQAAAARQQQQAAQPRNRWLGPIAGIAAGLGLAWLASSLGLGEEFGTLLLFLLVGMIALVAFRMFMARRAAARAGSDTGAFRSGLPGRDLAYEGAGSARPGPAGGHSRPAAGSAGGVFDGAGAAPGVTLANFDADQFVRAARNQYVRLQSAFDTGRIDELREFTTPTMFDELQRELAERHGAAQTTEILTLDAELLGAEKSGARGDDLAAVRFSGLLRESPQEPAQPVDEVWNFTRAGDGSTGWVLAGIQQRAGA